MKKAKLNYMSAVSKTAPVNKIPVSSSKMELLDKEIKQKIKQNRVEEEASIEMSKHYLVGQKRRN